MKKLKEAATKGIINQKLVKVINEKLQEIESARALVYSESESGSWIVKDITTRSGDIPRKPNLKLVIQKVICKLTLNIVAFNFCVLHHRFLKG